jgi:hypothetical protein
MQVSNARNKLIKNITNYMTAKTKGHDGKALSSKAEATLKSLADMVLVIQLLSCTLIQWCNVDPKSAVKKFHRLAKELVTEVDNICYTHTHLIKCKLYMTLQDKFQDVMLIRKLWHFPDNLPDISTTKLIDNGMMVAEVQKARDCKEMREKHVKSLLSVEQSFNTLLKVLPEEKLLKFKGRLGLIMKEVAEDLDCTWYRNTESKKVATDAFDYLSSEFIQYIHYNAKKVQSSSLSEAEMTEDEEEEEEEEGEEEEEEPPKLSKSKGKVKAKQGKAAMIPKKSCSTKQKVITEDVPQETSTKASKGKMKTLKAKTTSSSHQKSCQSAPTDIKTKLAPPDTTDQDDVEMGDGEEDALPLPSELLLGSSSKKGKDKKKRGINAVCNGQLMEFEHKNPQKWLCTQKEGGSGQNDLSTPEDVDSMAILIMITTIYPH